MVIARDISIEISSSASLMEEFATSVEEHASTRLRISYFFGVRSSNKSASNSGVNIQDLLLFQDLYLNIEILLKKWKSLLKLIQN